MSRRLFMRGLGLALLCLVAACAPRKAATPGSAVTPAPAAPADAIEYRLVAGESEIRILAYRDGPLASLGHNHVISTTAISGIVALASPVGRSVVELSFPVDSLRVDIPAQREEEGEDFPGALDQSAVDGTRTNMLGERVLNATVFPEVRLRSREIRDELPELTLLFDVTVRDQTVQIDMPATVTKSGTRLVATGESRVQQTVLGLEPFSVGLGALFVRDELVVKYRLVAEAAAGD